MAVSLLAIGKIGKSHGLKGFVRVHSFSGEGSHFLSLKEIFLKSGKRQKSCKVEAVKQVASGILMKVEGISTPEEAKKLIGLEIWVERKFASPIKKGEYYIADLVGCSVYRAGSEIGRLVSVMDGGHADLFEIVLHEGGSAVIPFTDYFVGRVDVKSMKIHLNEESEIP